MFKSIFMLASLTLIVSPLAAASGGAMADHAMSDHSMKPMSAADKRMMAKCHKMTPAMAAKNAKCVKLMMKPAESPMTPDHAM